MQQDDEDIQSPSDVADLSSTVCSIAKESIVNKEDDESGHSWFLLEFSFPKIRTFAENRSFLP